MNPEKPSDKPIAFIQILSGNYKGKQFRILSPITMGRHSDCDIIFKDNPGCSRHHAKITPTEGGYRIESLNPNNPVLINDQPVESHLFKSKDKIKIGNIELLFLENANRQGEVKRKKRFLNNTRKKSKKTGLTPPRLVFISVLLLGAYLLSSKEDSKQDSPLNLKTEQKVFEDLEALKQLNQSESEKKNLTPKEKEAQISFLKGFRDYRKGYFYRALKMFQYCLAFQTKNSINKLCESYSIKSKIQIEKLIQKKIRLGKTYKEKKQYSACRAIFKSVEIMIQDANNLIHKEARENRRLCEISLENKI